MQYRAEIDGLRAVAIISVILFHAGVAYFGGGFVGVDVFFVISGYLITTIILTEKEQGIFSLTNFYERRARRILPPLFLMLLFSVFFVWYLFLPLDVLDFSRSLVAVTVFSANIFFGRRSGYWEETNDVKPLLHTWSLSIEEQYYFLFPLFLMLVWHLRKRWIFSIILIIAFVSLTVGHLNAYSSPVSNFFSLIARVWELAIGASIAFYMLYREHKYRNFISHWRIDEVLSIFGLVMISYAVFAFDENVPFPSLFALVPTFGAGLVILFAFQNTLVGKLLGTKLLVGIGLISYSAYLWHQPLFVFAHYISIHTNQKLIWLMIMSSFLFGYLSWRYVERPFRDKSKVSRKVVFISSIVGIIIFLLIGLAGHFSNGFSISHITKIAIENKVKANYGLHILCESGSVLSPEFALFPDCRTSDNPNVLIWGDSFAMHLIPGIIASSPNAKIIQITSSCGPFFDIAPFGGRPNHPVSWARKCLDFASNMREWIKSNHTIKYVVIASPFSRLPSFRTAFLLRNGDVITGSFDLIVQQFEQTLAELKSFGITPVIFAPPPANGSNLGRCLARAQWFRYDLNECNFQVDEMSQDRLNAYKFLDAFKERYKVIRLDHILCDKFQCLTHVGSTFIYRDDGHLSIEGSVLLGKKYDFYKMVVDFSSSPLSQIKVH